MSNLAINSSSLTTAPTATAQPHTKSFLAHAKLIGLAREIVAAHYLGTGLVASAFRVAFTIPNLFRKLLGEGALSAAFIPLYAQEVKGTKAHRHEGTKGNSASVPSCLRASFLKRLRLCLRQPPLHHSPRPHNRRRSPAAAGAAFHPDAGG